jgi:hypothetical protein
VIYAVPEPDTATGTAPATFAAIEEPHPLRYLMREVPSSPLG